MKQDYTKFVDDIINRVYKDIENLSKDIIKDSGKLNKVDETKEYREINNLSFTNGDIDVNDLSIFNIDVSDKKYEKDMVKYFSIENLYNFDETFRDMGSELNIINRDVYNLRRGLGYITDFFIVVHSYDKEGLLHSKNGNPSTIVYDENGLILLKLYHVHGCLHRKNNFSIQKYGYYIINNNTREINIFDKRHINRKDINKNNIYIKEVIFTNENGIISNSKHIHLNKAHYKFKHIYELRNIKFLGSAYIEDVYSTGDFYLSNRFPYYECSYIDGKKNNKITDNIYTINKISYGEIYYKAHVCVNRSVNEVYLKEDKIKSNHYIDNEVVSVSDIINIKKKKIILFMEKRIMKSINTNYKIIFN